jgi:hypothetical protein
MRYNVLIYLKSALSMWAAAILLAGCSGYQYVASPRYVPLNEKKGELTANLSSSSLQVGYAFSNKFSAFTTGYMRPPTMETVNPFIGRDGQSERSGDSREINVGLSYYGKKNNILYEVLVGGGFGDMTFENNHHGAKNRDLNYHFKMQADRSNIFIQPNVSYKFFDDSKRIRLSIAVFTKFNRVYYHNIATYLSYGFTAQPSVKPDFDSGIEYFHTRMEANLFFIEPGIAFKAGTKNFKGMAQLAPVINLSGHALHYQMISLNIGLSINLNLRKNKE